DLGADDASDERDGLLQLPDEAANPAVVRGELRVEDLALEEVELAAQVDAWGGLPDQRLVVHEVRQVLGRLVEDLAAREDAVAAHRRRGGGAGGEGLAGGAGGARQAARVLGHVAHGGGEGARGRLAVGERPGEIAAAEVRLRRRPEPGL